MKSRLVGSLREVANPHSRSSHTSGPHSVNAVGDASVLFVGGVGNTKAELSVVSGFKPVAMALRYARIDCTYCGSCVRGGELEHRPRRARETGKASSEHIGVVFLL